MMSNLPLAVCPMTCLDGYESLWGGETKSRSQLPDDGHKNDSLRPCGLDSLLRAVQELRFTSKKSYQRESSKDGSKISFAVRLRRR